MLQMPLVQLPLPPTQLNRQHHLLSQRRQVQKRHQRRLVKHLKVLLLLSLQKMPQLPAPTQQKHQKRMQHLHKDLLKLLLKLQQRRLLKQALVRLTLLNQLPQLLKKRLLLLIRLPMLPPVQRVLLKAKQQQVNLL